MTELWVLTYVQKASMLSECCETGGGANNHATYTLAGQTHIIKSSLPIDYNIFFTEIETQYYFPCKVAPGQSKWLP